MGKAYAMQDSSANKAIDGIYKHKNSSDMWVVCVHTYPTKKAWWKVEFKNIVLIHYVRFYNRKDCCTERANNLVITTYTSESEQHLCANTGDMTGVFDKIFHCKTPLKGAKVLRIERPGENQIGLNFCEIEAFGTVA